MATAVRDGLGIPASVLPSASFGANGLTLSWLTSGSTPNTLSYTAITKKGGPTLPDFTPSAGQNSNFCSLLDINSAADVDSNGDSVIDSSTVTFVGRVPRKVRTERSVRVIVGRWRSLVEAGVLQGLGAARGAGKAPCSHPGYAQGNALGLTSWQSIAEWIGAQVALPIDPPRMHR